MCIRTCKCIKIIHHKKRNTMKKEERQFHKIKITPLTATTMHKKQAELMSNPNWISPTKNTLMALSRSRPIMKMRIKIILLEEGLQVDSSVITISKSSTE